MGAFAGIESVRGGNPEVKVIYGVDKIHCRVNSPMSYAHNANTAGKEDGVVLSSRYGRNVDSAKRLEQK